MRCNLPSLSTPTGVTHSRPGTGTSPNARCKRKVCSTRPMRSSGVRVVPPLQTVQECSASIAASSSGMDPFPITSATDRGNRGRPGLTMVSSGEAAAVEDGGGAGVAYGGGTNRGGGDSDGAGGGVASPTGSGWEGPTAIVRDSTL